MDWKERAETNLDNNGDELLIKIEAAMELFGIRKPSCVLVTVVEEYVYLRTAVLLALTDERFKNRLTKELYTAVAEKYRKEYFATTKKVEAGIEKDVFSAWHHGDTAVWAENFGYSCEDREEGPTTLQFIKKLAEMVREKL